MYKMYKNGKAINLPPDDIITRSKIFTQAQV